jgi:peptide/nickel transport system permease protein
MSINRNRNYQLIIGLGIIAVVLFFILIHLMFFEMNTKITIEKRMLPPLSESSLLGTDDLGRDLLSCVVIGTLISLLIGVTVVLFSAVIGSVLGMISGFAGGFTDMVIMRIVDVILSFPGILLAITMTFFFKQGILSLIIILTFTGWVGYARLVRGEVLKYKNQEFILAARCYNASFFRIIFFHLRPLILPLVFVQASLGICGVILAESSLNFLGLGLSPRIPTLGQLIDSGRTHIFNMPTLIIIPGVILFLIIIGFNFIGEGLRRKYTR